MNGGSWTRVIRAMWNLLDDFFAVFTMWKTEKDTEALYQETADGFVCPACGQRIDSDDIDSMLTGCPTCGHQFEDDMET